MINKKIKVGILFGGKSAEHEISLKSAQNVLDALDKDKYEPVLVGIDKSGRWLYHESLSLLTQADHADNQKIHTTALVPQSEGQLSGGSDHIVAPKVDVVFPILHGPLGEDGTIQGLLKLAHVPFVGAGVLGSAVGMDKDVMKRLLREAGLPIGKYIALRSHQKQPSFDSITETLGTPCFVKPANLGSSVGISRVENEKQYQKALEDAFSYDHKIIIEEFIEGREIECAILGNENPKASIPGEISFSHDFYSYEAKYLDDKGYKIDIPAQISKEQIAEIQKMAISTFQVLECEGFARVDVFLTPDGKILVNEINTIPGFTQISMYPKLWEASGISYADLIDRLLQLAIERFEKDKTIKSSV